MNYYAIYEDISDLTFVYDRYLMSVVNQNR